MRLRDQTLIQCDGDLFHAVQGAQLFSDSKTFVDSVPKQNPQTVMAAYYAQKDQPDFDLKIFVDEHFELPTNPVAQHAYTSQAPDVETYITELWETLRRDPHTPSAQPDTLLPLSYPYIVPGGRFREIYYWDSYFTALGLMEAGKLELVKHMVRNFMELQATVGLIPNGNRAYYTTRSQPPLLYLMAQLLWDHDDAAGSDRAFWQQLMQALEKEHGYWLRGGTVVRMPDGALLSRYWDTRATPREESWHEDIETAQASGREPAEVYRDLRAGAASGWDFSSRWCKQPGVLSSIRTTRIVPVDLNCFLWGLESTLSRFFHHLHSPKKALYYSQCAARRAQAVQRYLWSDDARTFMDYDLDTSAPTGVPTISMVTPLFTGLATEAQANTVAAHIQQDFLAPGGVLTTLYNSGEQWDAPNGWAPLQWLAIQGLKQYHHHDLADEIAARWLMLIHTRFAKDNCLLEKYNVQDISAAVGGGEYHVQEGFGWTNGVTLALLKMQAQAK